MPQGLPRKIRIAFIMQVVLASVAILVGAYLISAVAKFSLINSALQQEAAGGSIPVHHLPDDEEMRMPPEREPRITLARRDATSG